MAMYVGFNLQAHLFKNDEDLLIDWGAVWVLSFQAEHE